MDDYRSCTNNCIFCFIDQMPPNMRDTLYFKDDDSRLSFLQGNYITLTNMKDADVNRIIKYKLGPINISVHTTNPELRKKMLHNRFAGDSLKRLKQFSDAGIEMNAQIVLCKGVNDGEELERSISDLVQYIPSMQSLSIVPMGLTKFRDGLYPAQKFTSDDVKALLATVHKWQSYCYEHYHNHFIHASDEWYIMANEPYPKPETYDGYIQLENGVGMCQLLETEFCDCLREEDDLPTEQKTISVATGKLAAPLIKRLSEFYMERVPSTVIHVYEIRNDFFGEDITVSGLITGQDLEKQLSDVEIGAELLLPINMLRTGEDVFLDDMTKQELSDKLNVPITIVGTDGRDLVQAFKGEQANE